MFYNECGKLKLEIYGASHAEKIGVIAEGLPKGQSVDLDRLAAFLDKRRGENALSTNRREDDKPVFVSGIDGDVLNGEKFEAVIYNKDYKSENYSTNRRFPRPSHADYAAMVKYNGNVDLNGGGAYSGRMTAPLCIVGGIVKQLLEKKGIFVGAHVYSVGNVFDTPFDPVNLSVKTLENLDSKKFAVNDEDKGEDMKTLIKSVKKEGDSIGGIIECAVLGVPTGVGEPMFGGVENVISSAVFAVPAVKGIEFGNGFLATTLKGSENNDCFYYNNGTVKTKTNNAGGINAGMANGMPIIFRVAIKPTPTIFKEQQTVDLETKTNTTIKYEGRHDPCIVPRAVCGVESAVAIAIYNLLEG